MSQEEADFLLTYCYSHIIILLTKQISQPPTFPSTCTSLPFPLHHPFVS